MQTHSRRQTQCEMLGHYCIIGPQFTIIGRVLSQLFATKRLSPTATLSMLNCQLLGDGIQIVQYMLCKKHGN